MHHNYKKAFYIYLFAIICTWPTTTNANPTAISIMEPAFSKGKSIVPYLEILEDVDDTFSIQEIKNSTQGWDQIQRENLGLGFSSSTWWLKYTLTNTSKHPQQRLLFIEWNTHNQAELFKPGKEISEKTGVSYKFSNWALPYNYPSFELNLKQNETKTYYMKIRSKSFLSFPITLHSQQHALNKFHIWIFFNYTMLCAIIALFFYNIGTYYLIKDLYFLYFAFFILSWGLVLYITFGNAYTLLWPNYPKLTLPLNMIFVSFVIISVTMFSRQLLQIQKANKYIIVLFNSFIAFALCMIPLIIMGLELKILVRTFCIFFFFGTSSFIATAFLQYSKIKQSAVFLATGWIFLMLTFLPYILLLLGQINYNFYAVYSPVLFLPLPIAIFTYGNHYRRKQLIIQFQEYLLNKQAMIERLKFARKNKYKYVQSLLSDLSIPDIIMGITLLMDKKMLYLNSDLKMSDIAVELKVSNQQLSEILNHKMKISFLELIKEYRIFYAKKLLRTKPKMNLLEIAYESGFGSKASFNSAFKYICKKTPREYRKDFKDNTTISA